MLSFIEFFTSKNIIAKKIISKITFKINNNCRLNSVSLIKLLSIKVKNVKKPIDKVNIKISIKNKFFFINFVINYELAIFYL